MTRHTLTAVQRRALAATAGVVGRPRLRASLALGLAVACGPLADPGDPGASEGATASTSSTGPSSSTGSGPGSSTGAPALTTGEGTSGTGMDGGSTGDVGTTTGTTTGDGTTLLTDASTSLATTGEDETGTGDGTGGTGTTGMLEDCADPRTGEVDWDCCEAQNWEPFPQCTPWGPPAPPAVDGEGMQRARAARGRWV